MSDAETETVKRLVRAGYGREQAEAYVLTPHRHERQWIFHRLPYVACCRDQRCPWMMVADGRWELP